MPDNADPKPSITTRLSRGRRPSLAPREVVLGLDSLEHGVGLFGAGVAFILALVTAIEWIRNLPVRTTVKHVKGKACPPAYALHIKLLCEHVNHETRSYWEVRFFFIVVVALCLLYFTIRRKRAGVACFSVFLGLGLGLSSGIVFLFLGVWLILRAYRLQKYGVAGMLASNRVAREKGTARREGRAPNLATARGTADPTPKVLAPPSASKRYTPKKPPRKRR